MKKIEEKKRGGGGWVGGGFFGWSVKLCGTIIVSSQLTRTSSLNLPGLASWEVCKVQGKPKIGKVEESNMDLFFYFSSFSKFLNLGRKFNTNSNLPTFLLLLFFVIHLKIFIHLVKGN